MLDRTSWQEEEIEEETEVPISGRKVCLSSVHVDALDQEKEKREENFSYLQ